MEERTLIPRFVLGFCLRIRQSRGEECERQVTKHSFDNKATIDRGKEAKER